MKTLRINSFGNEVKNLQIALQTLGFYDGAIDGIFGERTKKAVKDFQSSNGLTPDGIVGMKTWNILTPYLPYRDIYNVIRGDTLSFIARKFDTTVQDIIKINPEINPDNLKIGQQIFIPFKRPKINDSNKPQNIEFYDNKIQIPPKNSESANKNSSVNVNEINGKIPPKDCDDLDISINSKNNCNSSQKYADENEEFEESIPVVADKSYIKYIIRSGDTLYDLAVRFGTTVNSIISSNPGISPRNLIIGTRILIPYGYPIVPTNVNYTYDLLKRNLQSLKVRYPFLFINSIGESVLNKNLYFVRIGNGRNEVFYNASHHANEWITSVVLMKYIEDFCKAYVEDGNIFDYRASDIFNNTSIYIVPMVNPDGVDLVTGAFSSNSSTYQNALALNGNNSNFPNDWSANIRGVDLNVNYPADWERAKEIKASLGVTGPGPKWYVGPYPLSEPETQAVASFTRLNNFRLTLSYHSQGEVIYWKYLDFEPSMSLKIANEFANVSGYSIENTPYESSFAGYKDWFIQEYNRPGYTIEVGIGKNPLPISQFNSIYEKNIGILTLGAIL